MRRTYISPEYNNNLVSGTLNMFEESTFFGSKMLEIEDILLMDTMDIIWYQKNNKEQLDLSVESALDSYFYSPVDDKLSKSELYMDKKQSEYQKLRNTRWVLDINLQEMLENYLFSTLKKYRTFEGVRNNDTVGNDVDLSIKNYITNNILNHYRFDRIDFYIAYRDIDGTSIKKYNNNWNPYLPKEAIYNKYETKKSSDDSNIKIYFDQKSSSLYIFDYFFNVFYEKI